MADHKTAVSGRLSDPDVQARLVRQSITLTVGMMALFVADIARDVYKEMHPPQPIFFRWDGRTAPQPMVVLSAPIVDDTELLQWSVKAVLAPYSVNYHDYPEQLNTAGRRFTAHGWNTFAEEFKRTGNLEAMKHAHMLCYAQAQRAALIRETKIMDGGRLAYDVQFPIVQTCQNSQGESSTRLMITALIVRTDIEEHQDGLAVDQLVADRM